MRIFHCLSYPLYSGPMPQTLALMQTQQQFGHEVFLAYDTKRGNFDGYEEAVEPYIQSFGIHCPLSLTCSSKSNPFEMWQDLRTLKKFLRHNSVDIIHVHMSHDHSLIVLLNILNKEITPKVIRTCHAGRVLENRFMQRFLFSKTDGFITRCQAHLRTFQTQYKTLGERARMIPGSIDSQKFRPATPEQKREARRYFHLPFDKKIIGQVALLANRGQRELIEAAAAVHDPNVLIVFAGLGEDESFLKKRVQKLGLQQQVIFLGYCAHENLQRVYHAIDIAYVAKPGNDASCRSILEAMASGLPVITASQDALLDIAHPDFAYSTSPSNLGEMVAAMRQWLQDDTTALKQLKARQHAVSRYAILEEAKTTLVFYQDVLDNRQKH